MGRPGWLFVQIVFTMVLLGFSVTSLHAIEIAVPLDMFRWDIPINNATEGNYYYSAVSTNTDQTGQQSYLLVLDWEGNLVHYRKPREHEERVDVFLPFDNHRRVTFSTGDVDESLGVIIMDSTYTPIDTIPHHNPHNPHYILDAHDLLMLDDGSLYTTWRDTQAVDMSLHIPDGDPDALVCSHVIEHWDAEHNLLWTWNGHDHIDQLPYAARIESLAVTFPTVEHLHINSLDTFANGDLLVSSRTLSVLFRVERETGDVLWRFGGGPLNDFEITNSTGLELPLDFNWQHDGRVLPNNNVTVFDNGYFHTPRESFAREYVLNEEDLSAELIWIQHQTPDRAYSLIHGSVRRYDDGHTLVGWGSITPDTYWQEFDENNDIVLELNFLDSGFGYEVWPRSYRTIRTNFLPIAAVPYLSEYRRADHINLYLNWWGHEDEVASYDVYWGQTNPPPFHGNTTIGTYTIPGFFYENTWYGRIKALDAEGNEISTWSETFVLNPELTSVEENLGVDVPVKFDISPNWPNPFNATTKFTIEVTKPEVVSIQIHDLLGRTVQHLHQGYLLPGQYPFTIAASHLPSGIFFVRATGAHGSSQTRRITLVK
jgi:Arylsulfotransferase (ASST)